MADAKLVSAPVPAAAQAKRVWAAAAHLSDAWVPSGYLAYVQLVWVPHPAAACAVLVRAPAAATAAAAAAAPVFPAVLPAAHAAALAAAPAAPAALAAVLAAALAAALAAEYAVTLLGC